MGIHDRIDYDGWWHVFIAREAPWSAFWADVDRNAHPPLFYLLLRPMTWLGSGRLVYRALSIAAAVAATYVVGLIATRVYRTPAVPLLCAFAFGLAVPTAIIACAVRSYMISIALVLVAFRLYLDLIDPARERIEPRTRILFVVALVGAILSHYSAIFFAGAAVALPCVYAAIDRRYRAWFDLRLRAHWRDDLATLVPIVAVIVAAYVVHIATLNATLTHTAVYYPDPAASAAGFARGAASFLAHAIVAEIDLFSPLPIGGLPAMVRALVVVLLAGLAAALVVTLRRRSDWAVASAPLGVLMVIAIAMMGAALARRYPFGGFLRQQFILFPLAMLAAFALVDEVIARRGAKRLVAALWVAVMLNAVVQRSLLRFFPGEPGSRESARFHRVLGDSRAVYVDAFSLVPFFAAHQRGTWSAQTELGEGFVALPVRQGEQDLLVVRDLTRWSADLSDPRLYRDLRRLLERTDLPSIDLFYLRQDAHLLPPTPTDERAQVAQSIVLAAHSADVHVERLVFDGFYVYARVQRSDRAVR
jgi:hypothetical protein